MLAEVFPVFIFVLIVYVILGHKIEQWRLTPGSTVFIHESVVAVIFGLVVGCVVWYVADDSIEFNTDVFYYIALPPIIFAQGFNLKQKKFFRFFDSIVVFGIGGALINFIMLSFVAYGLSSLDSLREVGCVEGDCKDSLSLLECLMLGAILSASDEVAAVSLIKPSQFPKLGALIFGEGVLNDALSILIFNTLLHAYKGEGGITPWLPLQGLEQLVLSLLIAVVVGLLTSRILFKDASFRHNPPAECAMIFLAGFFAYGLAEAIEVSGILSLFFAGIIMAHYGWHSLSEESKETTKLSLETLAMIAEAFSFAYLGMSIWSFRKNEYSVLFAVILFFAMCFVRSLMIFGLCAILDKFSKNFQVTMRERIAFAIGGCARGSVSWVQALQVKSVKDDSDLVVTTALIVIMMSTIGGGVLMGKIIKALGFTAKIDNQLSKDSRSARHSSTSSFYKSSLDSDLQSYSLLSSQQGESLLKAIKDDPNILRDSSVASSSKHSVFDLINPFSRYSAWNNNSVEQKEGDAEEKHDELTEQLLTNINEGNLEDLTPEQIVLLRSRLKSNVPFYKGIARWWIKVDERVMKPVFGGRQSVARREFAFPNDSVSDWLREENERFQAQYDDNRLTTTSRRTNTWAAPQDLP